MPATTSPTVPAKRRAGAGTAAAPSVPRTAATTALGLADAVERATRPADRPEAPIAASQNLIALLASVKEDLLEEMYDRVAAAGYGGLRPSHGCVFRYLDVDGSRLCELADKSGMTKQAFGEHVANVEALGYVTRVPDPADGRAKLVLPTPRGREALLLGREVFADLEREWAAAIGFERVAALRDTLERIHALQSARGALAQPTAARR
jgi:DNA-binding MarR family transcriptional regulator